jgi:hypothetical protein
MRPRRSGSPTTSGSWPRAVEAWPRSAYLAISLRNVGAGIAVLHGWKFWPGQRREETHAQPGEFTRLSRDLYVPVGDVGIWQGTFRDPATPEFAVAREAIEGRSWVTIELLYGDDEGGQRNVDRADPR